MMVRSFWDVDAIGNPVDRGLIKVEVAVSFPPIPFRLFQPLRANPFNLLKAKTSHEPLRIDRATARCHTRRHLAGRAGADGTARIWKARGHDGSSGDPFGRAGRLHQYVAPDQPIVIELNINIRQEVIYRLAEDAANTIDENADIF